MKLFMAALTSVAILMSGCATTENVVVQEEVSTLQIVAPEITAVVPMSIEAIITNQALASYQNKYLKATSHKAFAQSDSGVWNWKSNRTSEKHAMKSALISCQVANKKYEKLHPCKIINVDGHWVNANKL